MRRLTTCVRRFNGSVNRTDPVTGNGGKKEHQLRTAKRKKALLESMTTEDAVDEIDVIVD